MCEALNEELLAMFEKEAQASRPNPLLVKKRDVRSDLITFDLHPIPWILSKEGPPKTQISCSKLLY